MLNSHELLEKLDYCLKFYPLIDGDGLFSDTTASFVDPMQPLPYEKVFIRLRATHGNLENASVVSGRTEYPMMKLSEGADFDWYVAEVELGAAPFSYHFKVESGPVSMLYDTRGLVKDTDQTYSFTLVPGLFTPKWAQGAVMYQIYIDRFCNGDESNDVLTDEYAYLNEHSRKVSWDTPPSSMDVRNFYGGDLQGIIDKLDYFQELGIEVLYLNPVFLSPSNHKYDTQDYDHVDPHIGKIIFDYGDLLNEGDLDNAHASRYISRVTDFQNLDASDMLFADLVEKAHQRGMKVILDGVFNHCGSFNKWMDREKIYANAPGYQPGAYIAQDSPYHEYFDWKNPAAEAWPDNKSYDGWWGHETLPKLNYENSRRLIDYILYIGRKWVSPPFCADGWRLDVAADLGHSPEFNHTFWKEFRRAIRQANPEALVLAEHYGSAGSWLRAGEWDTVMNYDAFMEPVSWFLTGMQKHSDDYREDMRCNAQVFFDTMNYHMREFPAPAMLSAMNELSNHDHSRFLTRTNRKVGRLSTLGHDAADEGIDKNIFRLGVLIQMTWPGAPTVYYGDEAGLTGFTDPDNRRTYPWGHEDLDLIDFHKKAIKIHKESDAIRYGSYLPLWASYGTIAYGRFTAKEAAVILVNCGDQETALTLKTWRIGAARDAEMRLALKVNQSFEEYLPIHNGETSLTVPPKSGAVYLICERQEGNP
ncbi:MAG: glycoside hydrolase family 13 protein [Lachnospiraceae bacterium]|nr:glycoside hydrolase family 13 protein [Lachnospiraceae bacterium]